MPDFAEGYYYARDPNMPVLDGIWERIVNAAKGAALGTGMTMELEITGAVYNVLPNTRRGPSFVYKTRLADRKPALDYRK